MTRARVDVEIGQRFGGRFVVLAEVARGGMGVVYRARDEREGDEAALKILGRASGSALARFDREAHVLAQIDTPHVVTYRGHGREDDCPWIAMDWLEGVSLAEALDDGALEMPAVRELVLGICRGLRETHARGIIHRDLKPSNVFLPFGEARRAVILDFGVAQVADAQRLTDTGATLGTPAYMAPEQARGSHDVDSRADLYAVGALLFECLTGRPPFTGSTAFAVLAKRLIEDAPPVTSIVGGVPESLAAVVDRLLQRELAVRPADADEVADLLAAASFEPVSVVPKLHGPPAGATTGEQRVGAVLLAGSGGDDTLTASDARIDQAALRRIASSHGATIQLAASDAVVLTFTRNVSATDSAIAAARCALALQSAWPERAVAIATGHLVLGAGAIAGDAVDRAAELLDPTGGIGLDATTRELLGARFVVEFHEEGWRLKGEAAAAMPIEGSEMIGRRREVKRLLRAFEDVIDDGRPAVVLVSGAAGLGKSRLAAEGLHRLCDANEGLTVVVATGRPAHRDVPFGLAAQLVRACTNEESARAAEAFLETWSTPAVAGRDPAVLQRRLANAFTKWLGAMAATPVVLLLEDVHWADRPSVELIDEALTAVAQRPVLVVVLGRPELHERFGEGWRHHDRLDLRLSPLAVEASRLLLDEMGVELASQADILALADGNPFALLEMGRAERRGQGRVPSTVLAAAQARLDELSTGARRAARAASVFGRRFEPTGVAAVLSCSPGRVESWLDELTVAELVAPEPTGGLRFAHDLLVEATYATLVPEERLAAHGAAARYLDGRPGVEPDELSRHYRDGGDHHRAARWTMRAAERALALGDLDRALALCMPVDEADDETAGRLELVAAEVHVWRGHHDQAAKRAWRARELVPAESVYAYRAAGALFESAGRGADSRPLVALLEHCVTAEPEADAVAERWLALCRGAQHAARMGDYVRAESVSARLEALATPEAFVGQLHMLRGILHMHRGRPAAWLASMECAQSAFVEAGDLRNACAMRGEIGFAASEHGDYLAAEAMLAPALAQARALGLDHVVAWLLLLRGPVLARVQGLDEGVAAARKAVVALEPLRDPRLEGAAQAYLGALLLEADDLEEAMVCAREAERQLAPFAPLAPLALGLLARVAVASGDAQYGLRRAREARALIDEVGGVEEGEAQVELAELEALRALDRDAEAEDAAQRASERLKARAAELPEAARASFLAVPLHAALAATED